MAGIHLVNESPSLPSRRAAGDALRCADCHGEQSCHLACPEGPQRAWVSEGGISVLRGACVMGEKGCLMGGDQYTSSLARTSAQSSVSTSVGLHPRRANSAGTQRGQGRLSGRKKGKKPLACFSEKQQRPGLVPRPCRVPEQAEQRGGVGGKWQRVCDGKQFEASVG